MKRKLVSLVLVLCIVCAGALFAGCTGSVGDFDVIDSAIKKTEALDSADMVMEMNMDMSMEGVSVSVPVTANIKGNGLQSDSPTVSMDMDMSVVGQSMKVSIYQEGEWSYVSMLGMNYKAKTAELGGEYDYAKNANDMVKPIPEEFYKDAEKSEKDGKTTIVFKLDEEKFNEIYKDFIGDLNESSGTDIEGDVKISNAVVTIAVSEGYVVSYGMEFAMEYSDMGQTVKADVEATVEYKNPGKDVKVTPPEGYKDYEELDMSDLLDGALDDE